MATIENFINTVINNDIKEMVDTPRLRYLSFGVIASMIEFLGACFDKKDFFAQGCSGHRFRRAIDELDSFRSYRKYNKKGDPYDLYTNLRCGMAHIGKPDKEIAFTERSDGDGRDKHLRICTLDDSTTRLILVCEDLFCDLNNASIELIANMKSLGWAGKPHDERFMNPNLKILGCS
ncbi:MAG: hypothetical protein GJU72_03880 [Acidithiobacillus ferriphilus]|jgi:hypothetical protein|nr:hypothetical protein [Acidithiobacillus ferriphilus]